jgi:oligoribonuclease
MRIFSASRSLPIGTDIHRPDHTARYCRAMNDRLVWIDCEMTGLDLKKDALIEIAALVTDSDLTILGDGIDIVIHADDDVLASMPEVVVNMHASSGLTEEVRRSTVTMREAEERVLAYIKEWVPEPRTAPLAGNSIGTDRGYIARDMVELDEYLHYRMIDVSSIKELCRRWYPRIYFAQPAKGMAHRALADIKESIRELAYYRATAFVAAPGPSSDEAQAVAAQLLAAD